MNIAEILKLEKDEVIKEVEGTITKVYKAELIDNYAKNGKDWRQNIEITDETGIIPIQITKPESNKNNFSVADIGKKITLKCFHSEKNGWVGVKKKIYTNKKNEVIHQIGVTGTAKIEQIGENKADVGKAQESASNQSKTTSNEGLKGSTKPETDKEMWLNKELRANYNMFRIAVIKELLNNLGKDFIGSESSDIISFTNEKLNLVNEIADKLSIHHIRQNINMLKELNETEEEKAKRIAEEVFKKDEVNTCLAEDDYSEVKK